MTEEQIKRKITNTKDYCQLSPIASVWADAQLKEYEEKIKADERIRVLDEVNALIKTRLIDNLALDNATKYENTSTKQQANSYATIMKYEIADCVDDLLDDLEQLKEQTI